MSIQIDRCIVRISKSVCRQGWSVIAQQIAQHLPNNALPFRNIVAQVSERDVTWEVAFAKGITESTWGSLLRQPSMQQRRRKKFVVASIVPTGLRAEFGGFAGDATPVTNLMARACDYLITNPNAVTASDLYHADSNVLTLEGNLLCHYLVGNLNLIQAPPREIGVIVSRPVHEKFLNNVINAVNGMRTVAGLPISKIVVTEQDVSASSLYSNYGHASGEFSNIESLLKCFERFPKSVEAVAVASPIDVSEEIITAYYNGAQIPNPWGAAEAMLTHCLTSLFPMPITHAPLLTEESHTMMGQLVDPRDGAELISSSYICSVLSGLAHSPRPIRVDRTSPNEDCLSLDDLSALVLPANAVGGLPFFVAMEQGIPIILVENNVTCSGVTVESLGFAESPNLIKVHSYLEATGVIMALKSGIALDTLQRPVKSVLVERDGMTDAAIKVLENSYQTITEGVH
jgi:Protein of unknown function (DUF3326)